jgi:hypothetical protein
LHIILWKNNRLSRVPEITIVDHKKRKGISQHRTTNTTLNTKNTSLNKDGNSSINNQYLNTNPNQRGHTTFRNEFEIGDLININNNRVNTQNNNINNHKIINSNFDSNRGKFNFNKLKIKNDVP